MIGMNLLFHPTGAPKKWGHMGISPGDEWGRMGMNGTPRGGRPRSRDSAAKLPVPLHAIATRVAADSKRGLNLASFHLIFSHLGIPILHLMVDNNSLNRSEEHTSELQSRQYLVCRLLLEKKKQYIVFFFSLHEIFHHGHAEQVINCNTGRSRC